MWLTLNIPSGHSLDRLQLNLQRHAADWIGIRPSTSLFHSDLRLRETEIRLAVLFLSQRAVQ